MNKINISITSLELIRLVNETYEFIASRFKMSEDDIKLVATTLAEVIEKNQSLKS